MVGEHIRTRREGRWSHAIDCGDETVIHLADDVEGRPRVRRSYRPEFVAGAEVVQVVTHRERTFPPSEVVARAYSRIADPALAAMFRDSEAFAGWCATGRLAPAPANVVAPPPAPEVKAAAPERNAAAKRRRRAARARKTGKKPGSARAGTPRTRQAAAKARGTSKRRARKRPAAAGPVATKRRTPKRARRTTRKKTRR